MRVGENEIMRERERERERESGRRLVSSFAILRPCFLLLVAPPDLKFLPRYFFGELAGQNVELKLSSFNNFPFNFAVRKELIGS